MQSWISFSAIRHILERNWLEYRTLYKSFLLSDVLERTLYFVAFGFGLGAAVRLMGDVPYLSFLVAGLAAAGSALTVTMSSTYGIWSRMGESSVWGSWLATPLKLQEIILGEVFYISLRAMTTVIVLYSVAYVFDALPSVWGAVLTLPVIFLMNVSLSMFGLAFTSYAPRILFFIFMKNIWMMPMFLFSGTFFDLSVTPQWMQLFAHIFPLTYVIEITRSLILGGDMLIWDIVWRLMVVMMFGVVGFIISYRQFKVRLLDS